MAGNNRVDSIEIQKRIYQVGLMLRRKSMPFILEFIGKEWGIERAEAYRYISLAKKEWKKYFSQVKKCGMSYYVSQLRDLKDQAYSRKVIIGRGDNKNTVTIADLGLVFEITKEEAKLMGIYPSEKHDVNVKGKIEGRMETILKMEEDELDRFIEALAKRKTGINHSINRKEEAGD